MSQCHKCDKPCGHVLTFQIPSTLPYCVIGPVLGALPDASKEAIPRATAMLQGRFICGECAENHFGEDEPCPCHIDHPDSPACGFWTQREDKPCPTCKGSGKTKHINAVSISGHTAGTRCKTCGGSGERHSLDGWEYLGDCPTCKGSGKA